MTSSQPVFRFGEFLLNPTERRLVCGGKVVPLTPKVFNTLLLLVTNAGRLVEKEAFFEHLWPDAVVEESSLTQNISVLRKVLGDDRNGNNFIETVAKRGYRFVVDVQVAAGAHEDSWPIMAPQAPQHRLETERLTAQHAPRPVIGLKDTIPQVIPKARASAFRRWGVISAVGSLGLAGVYLALVLFSAAVGPRVTRITPIARSGKVDPWGRLVSDGARIYFLEREGDHWNLMQTSLNGGIRNWFPRPFGIRAFWTFPRTIPNS